MADAAISFAVEKLGDALIQKVTFLEGVEEQVRWLREELQSMQCFLKDAAEKQGKDLRIRNWIAEVREVAHDVEDVIDIFSLKVDTPRRKRSLLERCACLPVHASHLNRVGEEIQSIRSRLDEIGKKRERYGIGNLEEAGGMESSRRRSEMVEWRRRMAARYQKDKDVVGLNEDVEVLLQKSILEKKGGRSLAAIVGMGGIGKSTLARKIYNHAAVAHRFDEWRAWVVVSSEFAAEDIMKQIMLQLPISLDPDKLKALESIDDMLRRQEKLQQMLQDMLRKQMDTLQLVESMNDKLRRQEMLQDMLRKKLEGRRYFIVLDDVWEHTHWESLMEAFPDEQDKASRLLFTSRNQIITQQHGYIHKMGCLNPEESWELLMKTAFIGKTDDGKCPQELVDIGREILNKCHGLPLAITVAGGLLLNQGESRSGWEKVLMKQIKTYHLETSEIGTNVSAILELSYNNLPSQLKPCFLCLAFFKKDSIIQAKKFVHIWVAQGLIQQQDAGEETVEEIATSYLDELINRNLVQVKDMTIDGRVKHCCVHDLIRELSIRKAKEEIGFEILITEDERSSTKSSSHKRRHCVVRSTGETLIMIDSSNQNKHLRSLFVHVEGPIYAYIITPSYWKSFELLRILDIEGTRLPSLPSTIRALIGLRYLRLREVGRLTLPSWLDRLENLEVLDIADNESVRMPDVTWKMDSLRHFYIHRGCIFSNHMKISTWKNLETLKYIRSDNLVQGFSCLRKLGVELVGFDVDPEMERLLMMKSHVQVLHIRWFGCKYKSLPFLNCLDHLTKLKLHGRMDSCPSADSFPQNISRLTLSGSKIKKNDPMQELGKLPNLLFLKLYEACDRIYQMKVSRDGFPRLQVLHLRIEEKMGEILYIEEGGMPHLRRLETNIKIRSTSFTHVRSVVTYIE